MCTARPRRCTPDVDRVSIAGGGRGMTHVIGGRRVVVDTEVVTDVGGRTGLRRPPR